MFLFTGSYTNYLTDDLPGGGAGIIIFDFNHKTGKLKKVHIESSVINPTYLVISNDKKFLYTAEELSEGDIPKAKAYQINNTGSLTFINEKIIPGSFSCHETISQDGNYLLIACYGTGNGVVCSINPDGSLGKIVDNVQHSGSGPNKNRQEGPHAHMIGLNGKDEVYICDLGVDKVVEYQIKRDGKLLLQTKFDIDSGSGPRHLVFHPNQQHFFVFSELTSTITIGKKCVGLLQKKGVYNTLPSKFIGQASGSAIKISLDGKFVYSVDREVNEFTVYHFDERDESLELVQRLSVEGNVARDICLDPTGGWLISANQQSNELAIFKVNQQTGKLTFKDKVGGVVCVSCVVF